MQGDALRVSPELDDVAVSAQAQPTADHLHPSGDEQDAAPFGLVCVMAAGVVELAFDGMKVGDEVEAVILTLDRDERKMSLGKLF